MARDFYFSIVQGLGFKNLQGDVSAIEPGDIVALMYLERVQTNSQTGHVMIVDQLPVKYEPTAPIVEGTRQWAMTVLDSSGAHGKFDSRYREEGLPRQTGVGRGTIRFYTDDAGKIVGYAKSLDAASEFRAIDKMPIAVGRPLRDEN